MRKEEAINLETSSWQNHPLIFVEKNCTGRQRSVLAPIVEMEGSLPRKGKQNSSGDFEGSTDLFGCQSKYWMVQVLWIRHEGEIKLKERTTGKHHARKFHQKYGVAKEVRKSHKQVGIESPWLVQRLALQTNWSAPKKENVDVVWPFIAVKCWANYSY